MAMAKKTVRVRKGMKDLAAGRKRARATAGGCATGLTAEPQQQQADLRTTALWGVRVRPGV
jgi:hypothetical protein